MLDPCHTSYDSPIDIDPAPHPAVTAPVLLVPIPPAFSTLKLVSDTHSLASHPLGPHRPPGLTPCPAPIRSPPTHTPAKTCPAHPAAGPFADPTLLTETLSYDADTDTLPPLSPTVSTTFKLKPIGKNP